MYNYKCTMKDFTIPQLHIIHWLFNKHSLIVFLEALLRTIGNLSTLAGLAGEFHFFWISSVCFDEFFAIMAEKNDSSSVRIESNFFFSIGGDIHEVAFDAIESGKFSFWSWYNRSGCIWHKTITINYKRLTHIDCREERIFPVKKIIDKINIQIMIELKTIW